MNRGKIYFFIFTAVILGMVALQLQLHKKLDRHGLSELQPAPTVESMIKVEPPKQLVIQKTPEQKKLDEKAKSAIGFAFFIK